MVRRMENLKQILQEEHEKYIHAQEQERLKLLRERQKKHLEEAEEVVKNLEDTCLNSAKTGSSSTSIYTFRAPPVNNFNRYDFGRVDEEYLPAVKIILKAIKEKKLSWDFEGNDTRTGIQSIVVSWRSYEFKGDHYRLR